MIRRVLLRHLPEGYVETMNWGMISYEIPLERYPGTDNGRPLSYAGLAAQKNYFSLYLMCAYVGSKEEGRIREGFKKAGKTLDMGKSCIRFRRIEDLPLDVVAKAVASMPPETYIACYEATHRKK